MPQLKADNLINNKKSELIWLQDRHHLISNSNNKDSHYNKNNRQAQLQK